MSRELGDVIDIRPQSERIANNAVETLVGYATTLAEYGPLTLPPPWYKRIFWRWSYKLKEIVKIIKE